MGARLRLKASVNISGFAPHIRRVLQAMKTYGLIVADNGSDMFITGTSDPRWTGQMGDWNTAFHNQVHANDFEVVQLGWQPTGPPPPPPDTDGDGLPNDWEDALRPRSGFRRRRQRRDRRSGWRRHAQQRRAGQRHASERPLQAVFRGRRVERVLLDAHGRGQSRRGRRARAVPVPASGRHHRDARRDDPGARADHDRSVHLHGRGPTTPR